MGDELKASRRARIVEKLRASDLDLASWDEEVLGKVADIAVSAMFRPAFNKKYAEQPYEEKVLDAITAHKLEKTSNSRAYVSREMNTTARHVDELLSLYRSKIEYSLDPKIIDLRRSNGIEF